MADKRYFENQEWNDNFERFLNFYAEMAQKYVSTITEEDIIKANALEEKKSA